MSYAYKEELKDNLRKQLLDMNNHQKKIFYYAIKEISEEFNFMDDLFNLFCNNCGEGICIDEIQIYCKNCYLENSEVDNE